MGTVMHYNCDNYKHQTFDVTKTHQQFLLAVHVYHIR